MKQKVITSVIKKRFSNIQEYILQMLADFEEDAIHDFRTEIKKLRAFLRLLNTWDNKNPLSISKTMKVYYWYAGNIRNMQLHIKSINEAEDDKPSLYLRSVKKEIESLQGALTSLHSPSNIDDPKRIIHNWSEMPRNPSVKNYVYQKVHEYSQLLTLIKQDEILHAIRKLLKDLLYNWKYIKGYSSFLPPVISVKKEIEELTNILGEFCDRITGIQLLETYLFVSTNQADKQLVEKTLSRLNTEKNELRLKVYSMLNYNPA